MECKLRNDIELHKNSSEVAYTSVSFPFHDFISTYGVAVSMMLRMGWHLGQGLNAASVPLDNIHAALQNRASSYSEMWHTLTVTMAAKTLELKHRLKHSEDGVYTPLAFISSADATPHESPNPIQMDNRFQHAGC